MPQLDGLSSPKLAKAWRFRDRAQAGALLAERLQAYAGRPAVLVLALPRGGVPVAYEVARILAAPLDVLLVRKLGLPGHQELAMGAIADGGVRVLNADVLERASLTDALIEQVAAVEQAELERRSRVYRGQRPAPEVRGQTVILVDDGLATGTTMRAAVRSLRVRGPAEIIVAVPVLPRESIEPLRSLADEFVWVLAPEEFYALSQWYIDFHQVSDAEVCTLLTASARPAHNATPKEQKL